MKKVDKKIVTETTWRSVWRIYAIVKSGLTKEAAEKLDKEINEKCDYFTLTKN
jgi:hypothetical protein